MSSTTAAASAASVPGEGGVWNTNKKGRVPENIKKQSLLGTKCQDPKCNVEFHSTKDMNTCKDVALPIGLTAGQVKQVEEFLNTQGFSLSKSCFGDEISG
jgi:hypothetical protein